MVTPAPLWMTDGRPAQTSLAFFPLYPMVVRAVTQLTGIGFDVAAPTISLAIGAGAVLVVFRLVERCIDRRRALVAVVLLCTFASAPVFQAAYTESLGLLLAGVSTPSASPTAVLVVSCTRVAVGHHPECDTRLGSGDPAALGVADAGTQPAPFPATRPHAEDSSRPDQFATCGRRCRNRAVACDHRADHRRARCIPSHSPSLAWLLRLGAAVPVGRSCCLKHLATRHRVHWHSSVARQSSGGIAGDITGAQN